KVYQNASNGQKGEPMAVAHNAKDNPHQPEDDDEQLMLEDIYDGHLAPLRQGVLPKMINTIERYQEPYRDEVSPINIRHLEFRLLGNACVIHIQHTGTHQYKCEKCTHAG